MNEFPHSWEIELEDFSEAIADDLALPSQEADDFFAETIWMDK